MLRRFALAVTTLAALFVATNANAQQQAGGKVGIGVGLVPEAFVNPTSPAVEVYVPIAITPAFRLEPSVGIRTSDDSTTNVKRSDVTIGVGAFFVQRPSANSDLYFGGRLKLNFAGIDTPAGSDSGTDFGIAAAAGAEYYLAAKFSLGVEAQLGYYAQSDVSGDTSGFFTNGILFGRFYF